MKIKITTRARRSGRRWKMCRRRTATESREPWMTRSLSRSVRVLGEGMMNRTTSSENTNTRTSLPRLPRNRRIDDLFKLPTSNIL